MPEPGAILPPPLVVFFPVGIHNAGCQGKLMSKQVVFCYRSNGMPLDWANRLFLRKSSTVKRIVTYPDTTDGGTAMTDRYRSSADCPMSHAGN